MTRNLDSPEEKFIISVMSLAAADPKMGQMAYRLQNGTPRSYFTMQEANKLRTLIKQKIESMHELEGGDE